MANNNNRHHYFIKKKFQVDFILKFCLILLLSVLISASLLFVFSQKTLTSTYSSSGLEIQNTGSAILPAIILTSLITLGIVSIFAVVLLLFISHKIAGPLFRFEKDVRRIADGDLTVQINLRQKDQLKDLANALNIMVQSFSIKLDAISTSLNEIQILHAQDKEIEPALSDIRSRLRKEFKLHK
ncbi:MAG: methyl-accepting chemotaxis protein [Proteobacteria bacterium]|nr:methyl-accepting chemotaxis protein [Pseudomonadota bacterium]MBU1387600.1 methyl-accepting chemotaxis protein [Pseudomonadota bacterium]MBU1544191.1 methyl-accepting chemotaxis protein [Pseudomonadota bacterium]